MDDAQIAEHVSYYARLYPSLISFVQAAEIGQVTLKTIYHWSSIQRFDAFKSKCGRQARLTRDRFVRFLLTREQ